MQEERGVGQGQHKDWVARLCEGRAGVFFWKKMLSRIWTLLTLGAMCPATHTCGIPDAGAQLWGRLPWDSHQRTVTSAARQWTLVVSGPTCSSGTCCCRYL